jgi:cytochrome c
MRNVFLSLVVLISSILGPIELFPQLNNPPVVKIISPQNKNSFPLNSSVQFSIKISDKEDGESEYGEIATNEVFLEARYIADPSQVSTERTVDPIGLTAMKKSNCFSCHAFNGKLIAPSFHEITKRYPTTPTSIELLAKRIRDGSGGLWGTASMPSHTELSIQQAKEIADWIHKNGQDESLNYYIGTEGIFKLKPPQNSSQKGVFVLSATYSDHGDKTNAQQVLTSKDVIVVYIK